MTSVESRHKSGWEQLAIWLSRIFHPFIITIPTLIAATVLTGFSLLDAVVWTAVSAAIVILPTFLFIAYRVRTTRYSDWHVSIREQRHGLYLVGGLCLLLLLAALLLADAPQIILACLLAAILANIVGAIVNRFTKISVHAAAMAGCTTVFLILLAPLGIALGLMTLIVGWARIQLKHHTMGQVILGWVVASSCVWLVFQFYA